MAKKSTSYSDEPTEVTELPAGGTEGNTGLVPNTPEDFLTEQEKGGADPVSAPVAPGPLAEPVGVAPREPYPIGAPNPVPTVRVPHNEQPPEAA